MVVKECFLYSEMGFLVYILIKQIDGMSIYYKQECKRKYYWNFWFRDHQSLFFKNNTKKCPIGLIVAVNVRGAIYTNNKFSHFPQYKLPILAVSQKHRKRNKIVVIAAFLLHWVGFFKRINPHFLVIFFSWLLFLSRTFLFCFKITPTRTDLDFIYHFRNGFSYQIWFTFIFIFWLTLVQFSGIIF